MEYIDLKTFITTYNDTTNPENDFIEKLILLLQRQRETVNNQIFLFSNRLQDLKGLVFLQSELISTRQRLLEDIHLILDKLTILNWKLITTKKAQHIKLNKDYQVKFQNATERDQVISGTDEISNLTQKIESLTNHTIFLKDSMQKMDDMRWAIRNVIDINSMLGSVPK